jgi:hypothetical protein
MTQEEIHAERLRRWKTYEKACGAKLAGLVANYVAAWLLVVSRQRFFQMRASGIIQRRQFCGMDLILLRSISKYSKAALRKHQRRRQSKRSKLGTPKKAFPIVSGPVGKRLSKCL